MQFPVHIPFAQHLGFELLAMADGTAEIALDLQPEHANSFGVAHGGLTMTLLDVVMAHAARAVASQALASGIAAAAAARSGAPAAVSGIVTIEMKTSFLRPGEGRLLARGRLLHRTATLAFCEGSVFGASGTLCAHATATFKYLRALPAGAREPRPLNGPLAGSGSGSDSDSDSGND